MSCGKASAEFPSQLLTLLVRPIEDWRFVAQKVKPKEEHVKVQQMQSKRNQLWSVVEGAAWAVQPLQPPPSDI